MTKKSLHTWRANGDHLPDILRDFHDQKDIFRAKHEMHEASSKNNDHLKHISWIDGQCYTIDLFLWFMAQHGYTLQKCRANVEFTDIADTVKASRDRSADILKHFFKNGRQDIAAGPVE